LGPKECKEYRSGSTPGRVAPGPDPIAALVGILDLTLMLFSYATLLNENKMVIP